MTEDKTQILIQRYPKIFSNNFWFECDDGWFEIINNLCCKIQAYTDDFDKIEQPVAEQVKEKFGGLRFYISGGDEYIRKIISEAENEATKTCETCGAPGFRFVTRGWYRCRCKACNEQDLKVLENR